VIGEQIKARIRDEWLDTEVANWVISQLPLLDMAIEPTRPILSLSEIQPPDLLRPSKKLVISGGLEGTTGHVKAMKFARETRALMREYPDDELPIFALLEPDSFIEGKGRKPLATQLERTQLWAKSGLVDGIILLPDRNQDTSPANHYSAIHESIAPALWLTTGDNSAMVEILKRGSSKNGIDIGTIVPRIITPHASFLAKTKSMGKDDAKEALFEHVALLYRQKFGGTFARFSAQAHLGVIEAITDGLTEEL
jgi:hypothetical protein